MFSEEILGYIFLKEVNREITQIRNGQKKKSELDSRKQQGFSSAAPRSDRLFSPLSLIPKGNPGLFLPGLKQLRFTADH